jgi:CubicO group peptidase (beta-lactamase class C family)
LLGGAGFAVTYVKYGDDLYPKIKSRLGIPIVSWETSTPTSQGIDETRLDELQQILTRRGTRQFLLVRNGKIVAEWNYGKYNSNTVYSTAAMAKAVTGVTALLLALTDGKLALDDHLSRFAPRLENDPLRARIKIKHLAFHTSGIENVSFPLGKAGQLSGWKKEYYENPEVRFDYALNVSPVQYEPGSRGVYSGVGYYALSHAITKSYNPDGQNRSIDIKSLLDSRIMKPLGIPGPAWRFSYGESYMVDDLRHYAIGSGGAMTPRAIAKVAALILNRGKWGDKRLLDAEWIDQVLARNTRAEEGAYHDIVSINHGWSLNVNNTWPSLPRDAILGEGGSHQIVLVIPSLNLIAVRHGKLLSDDNEDYRQAMDRHFFRPLLNTIISNIKTDSK